MLPIITKDLIIIIYMLTLTFTLCITFTLVLFTFFPRIQSERVNTLHDIFDNNLEIKNCLYTISRRVGCSILMIISPLNISLTMLLLERFAQIVRLLLAAVSINGLRELWKHLNTYTSVV